MASWVFTQHTHTHKTAPAWYYPRAEIPSVALSWHGDTEERAYWEAAVSFDSRDLGDLGKAAAL